MKDGENATIKCLHTNELYKYFSAGDSTLLAYTLK